LLVSGTDDEVEVAARRKVAEVEVAVRELGRGDVVRVVMVSRLVDVAADDGRAALDGVGVNVGVVVVVVVVVGCGDHASVVVVVIIVNSSTSVMLVSVNSVNSTDEAELASDVVVVARLLVLLQALLDVIVVATPFVPTLHAPLCTVTQGVV
jgi:hypothetical protein